jgi:metacaspase-1
MQDFARKVPIFVQTALDLLPLYGNTGQKQPLSLPQFQTIRQTASNPLQGVTGNHQWHVAVDHPLGLSRMESHVVPAVQNATGRKHLSGLAISFCASVMVDRTRLFLLLLLFAAFSASPLLSQQGAAPRKRALLVAIDNYPSSSGYDTIHASNDIPLVRAGLESQGFTSDATEVLMNEAATREGIVRALQRLGAEARPGDIIAFFYAGHGCQITDDNGDEIDGYDEALVPVDAIDRLPKNSSDSRHLRDDELNRLVASLREKVGSTGDVIMMFDACNSGSITRGPAEAPIRGRNEPLGPPAAAGKGKEGEGTIADVASASTRGGSTTRAPYIVLSACQHYQSDHEITIEDGNGKTINVGPLSYALSKALPAARPGATYRSLFEDVKTLMAAQTLLQLPQMEGDLDVALFSGEVVDQKNYHTIARQKGKEVVLRGGTLLGLFKGTTITFHPVGTTDPSTSQAIASGVVIEADHLEATVQLSDPVPDIGERLPWAFVDEYAYDDLRLRVRLDRSLDRATTAALEQSLKESRIVDLVTSNADVIIHRPASRGTTIQILTRENDTLLVLGVGRGAHSGDSIIERLRGYARAQYLRELVMYDNTIKIEIEIIPAALKHTDPDSCNGVTPVADTMRNRTPGGQLVFKEGEAFMLRVRNTGSARAWINILDIAANGTVCQLYPLDAQARDNQLAPGGILETSQICYVAGAPYGTDVIKVFATRDPVSFAPVIATRGAGTRGSGNHPLEDILAETFARTRGVGAAQARGGAGATAAVTIVVPAPARSPGTRRQ